ncbi:MAG: DNA (cytosine-5-)-methyltransferase [Microcystis aeruginosa K13-05]|jgi:DNA (cytosine-5)-methyltransferase 1|uniref:DNA cytosine methyltransferase n=1 Tax=unclassified Microcystis TaxID=2643300 RepID=UPI0022C5BCF9|nr:MULTISPECIES: DNA (cytosine-5-)-methyltransferase [unclassified Microcystis]MCZ8046612.1 DNA (cytosine-5-)-methyltransferase [Microcystis sp. LE19-41.2A]MCZ8291193.1 DNA (cytosine-5-)-methyltransferase [Microcystis sp. LE19-59.1C]NCR81116.1 DNA (cytosine-5-)-methyltransferase [Microcystis aeruginosa K13-10]NCR85737.1 DNA (cytosine-5-)-methyltransferase [Microcystis aeruginosa K13-05]
MNELPIRPANKNFTHSCLTFADFYAGIGGFRLGLEQIGWQCVFSNENNPDCVKTYNHNFHESIKPQDVEALIPSLLPDFEVFCGGFPCQPFSRAGQQKGWQDSRGLAIQEILRICHEKKPKVIFLENVSNIVRLNQGQILKDILIQLKEINYLAFYAVIDSKYFQIPQSRPRFFLLAFRKDLGIKNFQFPQPCHAEVGIEKIIVPGDYSIPISEKWQQYIDYYAGRITAEQLSFQLPKTRISIERASVNVDYDNCIYQMRSSGIRAISIQKPFPTFAVSVSGGGAMIPVYSKERRHLSLLEIKRLMGFADDYYFPVSRTAAIKQLSNAVCPPVIKHIGRNITKSLN